MVAGQDRDAVAAPDAHCQQAVGDGVRGVVEFFEGDLAVVVDDGGAIRGAAGVERGHHADFAPAPDVGDHGGDVLRRLELERARSEHLRQVVQFGGAAFGNLLDFGDCLQRNIG